jgi:uncharacterized protein YbaP (TraB family)
MKKTSHWFLGLASIVIFNSGWVLGQSRYEMLWEVQHPTQTKPSYVFGTMHISDPRAHDVPDAVWEAMNKVDQVAFETDLDSFCVRFFDFVFGVGEHSISELNDLESKFKGGFTKPSNWEELIQDPDRMLQALKGSEEEQAGEEGNPLLFLDATLFRVAKQMGKKTTALETTDSQLELMLGLSGDALLASTVSLAELKSLYLSGNLAEIGSLLDGGRLFGPESKEALIDARNRLMVQRSDSIMRQNIPLFVAVGAAHLPGRKGILELFRELGYSIRPVEANINSGKMRTEVAKPYSPAWMDWADHTHGMAIRLPGKPYKLKFKDVDFPLFAGLDFQGGFMYYYMAVPTGEFADESQKEAFAQQFMENLGQSGLNMGDEPRPVMVNGMPGMSFSDLDGEECLRGQVLVGDEMAYVLFAGIDRTTMESSVMNEMFNSVRSIPIVQISDGPWTWFRDKRLGVEALLPQGSHLTFEPHESAMKSPYSGTWNHKASDVKSGQEFWLSVTSLPPHYQYNGLDATFSTIVDLIGDESIVVEAQQPWQDVNGNLGLKARFKTQDGSKFLLNMALRGNRLYLVGATFHSDDRAGVLLESRLDSLKLLPLGRSELTYKLAQERFEAFFPDEPFEIDMTEQVESFHLNATAARAWEARDPQSGYAFSVANLTLGPYYRLDSLSQFPDTLVNLQAPARWIRLAPLALPGMNHAWRGIASTSDGLTFEHVLIGVKGREVFLLKAQSNDSSEKEISFFNAFNATGPEQPFDLLRPKLSELLKDCESEDEGTRMLAQASVEVYAFAKPEMPQVLDFLRTVRLDQPAPDYVYVLIDNLFHTGEDMSLSGLKEIYLRFSIQPDLQVFWLSEMLQCADKEVRWAALPLLRNAPPNQLDGIQLEDMGYGISGFLMTEQDAITAFDSLLFLRDRELLQPLFWQACWEMGRRGDLELRHLGLFRSDIYRIATDWVLNPRKEIGHEGELVFEYDLMLWALAAVEPAEDAFNLIQSVMDLGDPIVQEFAAITLLESDQEIPKRKLRAILDQPGNRFGITDWMLEHEQTQKLPKQYFKPERLATIDLESYIQGNYGMLLPFSLQEKRSVYFEGQQQDLFIFKVGTPDGKDWMMGFAGPMPSKGMVSNLNLALTGIDEDLYPRDEKSIDLRVSIWIDSHRILD